MVGSRYEITHIDLEKPSFTVVAMLQLRLTCSPKRQIPLSSPILYQIFHLVDTT